MKILNSIIIIRRALYQAAGLGYTITYDRLQKKCNPNLTDSQLFGILLQIDDEEYQKHRIHLTAVAVQRRDFRYPLYDHFSQALKGKPSIQHKYKTISEICLLEKARTIEFVRQLKRPKKPTHNLW